MPTVSRPMHGVDFGEMALEGALGLHKLVLGDGLVSLLGNGPDCRRHTWVSLGRGMDTREGFIEDALTRG